ncbi:hypothetical protein BH18ACT1_BH18ACT1_14200 [soil metagenome]
MRAWVVAAGLIEGPPGADVPGLLLVQNRRRDGRLDWSPPGGVVEVEAGESVVDGLTREVEEETGIRVTRWDGPVYDVEAEAPDQGWQLRVEVFVARAFEGELRVDDPDGIVVDARFVPLDACALQLEEAHLFVREPVTTWLSERHVEPRSHRYRVEGGRLSALQVVRLSEPASDPSALSDPGTP